MTKDERDRLRSIIVSRTSVHAQRRPHGGHLTRSSKVDGPRSCRSARITFTVLYCTFLVSNRQAAAAPLPRGPWVM